MQPQSKELLAIIDKMKDTPVLVVGDIILDRYIWGKVDRISPEAPVPVVQVTKMEDRLGGAGNVVRNLRSLGAQVNLCGFISDDDEGKVVLQILEQDGIGKDGVIVDRSCPTSLKTRVIAHAQQVVRIDRESATQKSAALREAFSALVDAQIDQSKIVIVSDYGKGAVTDSLMKKFEGAKEKGRIGIGSRPLVVDPHPTNYGIYWGISVAKPNRKEAEAASGVKISDKQSALHAAHLMLKKWNADMILLSMGESGLLIASAADPSGIFLETAARQVYDVSGAGDTVTSVFSLALAIGATPREAGVLANIAAGLVVAEVGTVAIENAKLRRELEQLSKGA